MCRRQRSHSIRQQRSSLFILFFTILVAICYSDLAIHRRRRRRPAPAIMAMAFSSSVPISSKSLLMTNAQQKKRNASTNHVLPLLQHMRISRFSYMDDRKDNLEEEEQENDLHIITNKKDIKHIKSKMMPIINSHRRRFLSSIFVGTTTTTIMATSSSSPTYAISPQEASTSYDTYAPTYDALDGGVAASALGIDAARSLLLSTASGSVLEIGVGTGLNVNKYVFAPSSGGGGVTSLTLVDISEGMLDQAKTKVNALNNILSSADVNVNFVKADATSNELVDKYGLESFDTVVDTFSLCVMGNDGARDCLRQMSKLVKKEQDGGRILLIENTRASNPLLGWYQDVTAEAAASAGGKGCLYNQDVTAMIQQIGTLKIVREESFSGGLFRSFVCVKK